MTALRLIAVAIAFAISGCAAPVTQRVAVSAKQTEAEVQKQNDILAEDMVADRMRLARVHYRLATNSTSLCPKLIYASGVDIVQRPQGELGESMGRLYGIAKTPTVLHVIAGGPADIAGLKPRDQVVSIWGMEPTSQNQKAIADRNRSMAPTESIPVQLRRGGELMKIDIAPVKACDYPASMAPEQVVNAYADGERIIITRGMMGFVRSDEELALVVAHEMAHNTMRHLDAKKVNAAAGLVGDVALAILSRGAYRSSSISDAASRAYSQEFEAEADYVGLYMLAISGYSVEDAPKFWRRMAAANPGNIKGTHASSHPPTSYRMVALEEAAKEIDEKRRASASLVPVRKDGAPFVAGEGLFSNGSTTKQDTSNCMLGTDGRCLR